MTWETRFRVRQYVTGSLWVAPIAGAIAGALIAVLAAASPGSSDVPDYFQYSAGTAQALLTAIVGAIVALFGFVVTVAVLVVQMATGTFSARYMRLWYRDRVFKAVLALLVGTFTFSYSLLRRIEQDDVPNIGVTLAGMLVAAALVLFVFFLDRSIHRMRPVAVAALVARAGRRSMAATASAEAMPTHERAIADREKALRGDPTLVVRSQRAGSIQAIDGAGLARWARRRDCMLHLPHAVGDFVATGERLVEARGHLAGAVVRERDLRGRIALGVERTIDQDPAFALRVMVDVAIRALSPAVNDPTTAVQVIDHLEDLLILLGSTADLDGHRVYRDVDDRPRVVLPAHSWEDYLSLAVTEIRSYGTAAVQVMRRLRAMLEVLQESVRPEYRAAVEDELARLDATLAEHWGDSVDLDRAGRADRQGIGGPATLSDG